MNEEPGKPWYLSKGIIGALVSIIAMVLGAWQYSVDQDSLTEIIIAAVSIVGTIVSLIGRIQAKSPIVFKGTKEGGPYNPNAEVRRAEPVHRARFPQRGGNRKGFIRSELLGMLFALAIGVVGTIAHAAQAFQVPEYLRTVDPETCGGRALNDWIGFYREDARPFLTRLATSIEANIKWKAKQDALTGAVHVGIASVEIKGGAEF